MRIVHDFEEDCMDDLSRKIIAAKNEHRESRWNATAEKYYIIIIINTISDKFNTKKVDKSATALFLTTNQRNQNN